MRPWIMTLLKATATLGLLASPSAFGLERAEARSYNIKIGISQFFPAQCDVILDETDTLVLWPGPRDRKHAVRLLHNGSEEADAFWNGLGAVSEPTQGLGRVIDDGRCWRGPGMEICYDRIDHVPDNVPRNGSISSGLGNAVRGLGAMETLTCVHTGEDALPPEMRATSRAMALSDYTDHLPREHSFARSASGEVTRNGRAVDVLFDENGTVSFSASQIQIPGALPGTFSPSEQESWRAAQRIIGNLAAGVDQAMGMGTRLYILSFRDRTGYLATLNTTTKQLEQVQQIECW